MLHLERRDHRRAGLVAVSLVANGHEHAEVLGTDGPRVIETDVADRLEHLVSANVVRAAASGRRRTLDLDALVARAERDLAGCWES